MGTPTIEIDTERRCTKCGHAGATPSGLCMNCISQSILSSKIGEKVFLSISDRLTRLLRAHKLELNEAYINAEDSKLKVACNIEIKPGERGNLIVVVKISFVGSRVQDESTEFVDDIQGNLFDKGGAA